MSKSAHETELQELHELMAKVMRAKLESGEVDAATLNSIRQFLKDNGIECARGRATPSLKALEKAYNLPFAGTDELPN